MTTFALAIRNVVVLLRRSRAFGVGVALVTALVVVVSGLVSQAAGEVRDQVIESSIMRTIEVRSQGQGEPIPLTQDRIDELASIAGVAKVRPWVQAGTLIVESNVAVADAGRAGTLWATPYMMVGQPPIIHAERSQLLPLLDGEAILPSRVQGKTMTELLGERIVVEYTQRVSVDAGEARHIELHVVGLYDETVGGRDGPAAMYLSESTVLEMAAANEGMRPDDLRSRFGFPRVIVETDTADDVRDVQRQINEQGYFVSSIQSLMDNLSPAMRMLDMLARLLAGVLLLACVIAGLTIGAGLICARWRDIGVLKEVGFSNGRIARLLGAELGLFGLLAGLTGVGTGLAVLSATQWLFGGGELFGTPIAQHFSHPPAWVVLGLAVAPSAAMLTGAVLPMLRVSVVPPEDAMRSPIG